MTIKFSKPNAIMKERAKELRKYSTLSEVLLWNELKNKKICGLDFDRQKVINNRYILDFYCPSLNLAIEIDGISHDNKYKYDAERHNYLVGLDMRVLHFSDDDIKKRMGEVLFDITEIAKQNQA